ncbi:MAG: hypothetical protein WAW13_03120 [Minisyncoccia bacterium]
MKTVLITLAVLMLGGCANSTLIVRGNMPGTAWVAEKVAQAHSTYSCSESRAEKREVKVQKRNNEAKVYLRHDCAN